MLFGDTDVKYAIWELRFHLVQASARWHGGGDRDNFIVTGGGGNQTIGKYRGVAWHITGGFLLRSGDHIKFWHRMIFFGGWAGKWMTMPLFGDNMD